MLGFQPLSKMEGVGEPTQSGVMGLVNVPDSIDDNSRRAINSYAVEICFNRSI